MNRPRSLAGFAMVFVVIAGLVSTDGARAADVSSVSDAELQHAVERRDHYGFRSDDEYVRLSLTDQAAFPDEDLGFPLTREEAAEIHRRAALQAAKEPLVLYASSFPSYAGLYTDHKRGGLFVVLFAGDGPTKAELMERAPDGADVEVRTVEHSYVELQGTKADLLAESEALAKQGIVINSVGLRPSTNSLVVGMEKRSSVAESTLLDRFGPNLEFQEIGKAEADTCTSNANCWPPKGGFKIVASIQGNACTSGWIVKRADLGTVRQILTAGHCLHVAGGVGTQWKHGSTSGTGIGNSQHNTWTAAGTHPADVGLIGIVTTAVPTIKNQFISGTGGGAPIVSTVTSYSLAISQNEFDVVCRYGIKSLKDCGDIEAEDVSHISCIGANDTNCKTITRTWQVEFDSDAGDSGGPMFRHTDPPSVALGTHVHSTLGYVATNPGWYSPYDIGRNEWQAETGLTFNICLSSTCP